MGKGGGPGRVWERGVAARRRKELLPQHTHLAPRGPATLHVLKVPPQHNDRCGDGGGRRAESVAAATHDGAAAERLHGRALGRARECLYTPPFPRGLLPLHVARPRLQHAQQPLQLPPSPQLRRPSR